MRTLVFYGTGTVALTVEPAIRIPPSVPAAMLVCGEMPAKTSIFLFW